jgi:eukaryotic-like serine/threonine-protein kinase
MTNDVPASRPAIETAQMLEFGRFHLDVRSRQLYRDGQLVDLPLKALELLIVLITNRARTVGKDELLQTVWADAFVAESSLTHCVSSVRQALGDDPSRPEFIATIARRGYRFIAAVRDASVETAAPDTTALSTTAAAPTTRAAENVGRMRRRLALIAGVCTFIVGALGALSLLRLSRNDLPASNPIRLVQEAPRGTTFASGGILSPDGRSLAFIARDDRSGRTQLWIRALNAADPHALAETEGAERPFWSPDGQNIAFFAGNRLKAMSVGSDARPRTIAQLGTTGNSGGTWNSSGLILFAESSSDLYGVPSDGGAVTRVTKRAAERGEMAHRWPQFMADGRHFIYYVDGPDQNTAGTYIGALNDIRRERLLDQTSGAAVYVAPDYLLFVRDRVLFAQRFDASRLNLMGASVPITSNVVPLSVQNNGTISATGSGLLAFGGGTRPGYLTWFDRSGEKLATVDAPAVLRNSVFSPDGTLIFAESFEPRAIWMVDIARNIATSLFPDGRSPKVSPDGTAIVFTSNHGDTTGALVMGPTNGGGQPQLLLHVDGQADATDWTLDGRYIVYVVTNPRQPTSLWLLPMFGDRKPLAWSRGRAHEMQGHVSPNGRWIAYASDESGRFEIYLRSFPAGGEKYQVSNQGGTQPEWRRDGAELFYLAANSTLMSVGFKQSNKLTMSVPKELFRLSLPDGRMWRNYYAATAKGDRFVVESAGDQKEPITVIVNWQSLLAGS